VSFTVIFCKEDALGKMLEYEVIGRVSRYYPARINCRNEDARPEEGGDVEIECIMLDGKIVDEDIFSADEQKAIEEQLADAAANDEPDYVD
jgi:hypothetical protein